MGVTQDGGFEALGGDSDTGFFCHGAQLQIGGDIEGQLMGLRAKARNPGPDNPFDQPGIFGNSHDGPGIVGTTNHNYGIFGQFGNLAPPPPAMISTAGVCGTAEKGFGVAGITKEGSAGVFGQFGNLAPRPPATISTAGVCGTAEKGFGVAGITKEGSAGVYGQFGDLPPRFSVQITAGVCGTAQNGFGVAGIMRGGLGSGVWGQHGDPIDFPASAGIVGNSQQSSGVVGVSSLWTGVFGTSDKFVGTGGASHESHGIMGITDGPMGPDPSTSPAGFYGLSTNGSIGVLGVANLPGAGIVGIGTTNDANAGVFLGNVVVSYVRRRGTSFEVHELQGGTSNVAFSYRIVAKRKDIKAHTRFAKIDATLPGATEKPRAARRRKAARLPSAIRKLLATLEKHAPKIQKHTPKIRRKPRLGR